MTNNNPRRRGSLGGLLTDTAEPQPETRQALTPVADEPVSTEIAKRADAAPVRPAARPADRLWAVMDDETGTEIARVFAPNQSKAITQATQHTGRQGGFSLIPLDNATAAPARTLTAVQSAQRGAPAVLPRSRRKRIARDKLTAQVSVKVLDALDALVQREGTRKYDEVEAALRTHLTTQGIPIDEES
jgi:hypothetical protein